MTRMIAAAVLALAAGSTAHAATLTTLHSFSGDDGSGPFASLIADASGSLFGTTRRDGASGLGTIFRIGADGSDFTTLHSFSVSDGSFPRASLIADSSGNLLGTTEFGGDNNWGTIFRIGADGSDFTTLHRFTGSGGRSPSASLIADASGNLFGTTAAGGAFGDRGTIFRVGADGSDFTTLHKFSASDGRTPLASLIADASGNLFGTTSAGGANGQGTIFRIGADGSDFTTLYSFSGGDGRSPVASLIADASGNLFGTTGVGGASGRGTIFRIGADGSDFTTLYSFSGSDGANPLAGLIADASGNLFGTTAAGGASNLGTIFRLSGAGFVIVPEPASWAMMIAGFGLVGAAARRRRLSAVFSG